MTGVDLFAGAGGMCLGIERAGINIVLANDGTPSSSRCIHPFQDRALSTREAARLQGFPDSFIFKGGKGSKNLQIGNAVPPMLAEAIGRQIKNADS